MTHRQRVWTLLHEKQQIKPGLLIFGCDCYTFVNSKKKKKNCFKVFLHSSPCARRAQHYYNAKLDARWTFTHALFVCLFVGVAPASPVTRVSTKTGTKARGGFRRRLLIYAALKPRRTASTPAQPVGEERFGTHFGQALGNITTNI